MIQTLIILTTLFLPQAGGTLPPIGGIPSNLSGALSGSGEGNLRDMEASIQTGTDVDSNGKFFFIIQIPPNALAGFGAGESGSDLAVPIVPADIRPYIEEVVIRVGVGPLPNRPVPPGKIAERRAQENPMVASVNNTPGMAQIDRNPLPSNLPQTLPQMSQPTALPPILNNPPQDVLPPAVGMGTGMGTGGGSGRFGPEPAPTLPTDNFSPSTNPTRPAQGNVTQNPPPGSSTGGGSGFSNGQTPDRNLTQSAQGRGPDALTAQNQMPNNQYSTSPQGTGRGDSYNPVGNRADGAGRGTENFNTVPPRQNYDNTPSTNPGHSPYVGTQQNRDPNPPGNNGAGTQYLPNNAQYPSLAGLSTPGGGGTLLLAPLPNTTGSNFNENISVSNKTDVPEAEKAVTPTVREPFNRTLSLITILLLVVNVYQFFWMAHVRTRYKELVISKRNAQLSLANT